jgi:hypothetical protein
MIRHPGSSWREVPDLPKAAVAALDAGFALHTTRLLAAQRSSDGETTKLLVQLQDGLQVESVVMEYDNTGGWGVGGGAWGGGGGGLQQQPGCPSEPACCFPASAAHADCLPPPTLVCSARYSGADEPELPPAQQPAEQAQQQGAALASWAAEQQQQQQQQQQDGEHEEEEEFFDAVPSLGDAFGGKITGGRRATLCVSSEVGCAMVSPAAARLPRTAAPLLLLPAVQRMLSTQLAGASAGPQSVQAPLGCVACAGPCSLA